MSGHTNGRVTNTCISSRTWPGSARSQLWIVVQKQGFEDTKRDNMIDSSDASGVCSNNDMYMDDMESMVEALDDSDYHGCRQRGAKFPLCNLNLPVDIMHNNDNNNIICCIINHVLNI